MTMYRSFSADIPVIEGYVRTEALFDGENKGPPVTAYIHRVVSLPDEALRFNLWLENGAMWNEVPLNMVCMSPDAPLVSLETLQMWNNFADEIVVDIYSVLRGCKVAYRYADHWPDTGGLSRGYNDSQWLPCDYLFTVDWPHVTALKRYGDVGHKCGHVLLRPDGNLAVQPNNRCCFLDPATVTEPYCYAGGALRYKTRTGAPWENSCEAAGQWAAWSGYLYDISEPSNMVTDGTPAPLAEVPREVADVLVKAHDNPPSEDTEPVPYRPAIENGHEVCARWHIEATELILAECRRRDSGERPALVLPGDGFSSDGELWRAVTYIPGGRQLTARSLGPTTMHRAFVIRAVTPGALVWRSGKWELER